MSLVSQAIQGKPTTIGQMPNQQLQQGGGSLVSKAMLGVKMTPQLGNVANQPQNVMRQGLTGKFLGGLTDVATGALKGVGHTIANLGEFGAKAFSPIDKAFGNVPIQHGDTQQALANLGVQDAFTPTNLGQKIGFGGEQLGEFFLPTGVASEGVKAAEAGIEASRLARTGAGLARDIGLGRTGAKIGAGLFEGGAKLGSRAAIDATVGGGVTAAQGGNPDEVLRNSIISGAVPVIGSLFKAAKPLLGGVARKIENVVIKPTSADIKDGFATNNIFKYKLGGSLQTTAQKTNDLIEQKATELKGLVAQNPTQVNINSLIDAAEAKTTANKAANFGFNSKLQGAFDTLRTEVSQLSQDGIVDLSDAQQIKRSVGKLGAWQYGVRDPEATALEKAANSLYTELRTHIEKVSPPKLRQLNRELSQLIPIENAIIRRIPVAERNNVLSLGDLVSASTALMSPKNFWLFTLNKLLRSGNVANVLNKAAAIPTERGALGTLISGSPK